jgi:hypothetical protein
VTLPATMTLLSPVSPETSLVVTLCLLVSFTCKRVTQLVHPLPWGLFNVVWLSKTSHW